MLYKPKSPFCRSGFLIEWSKIIFMGFSEYAAKSVEEVFAELKTGEVRKGCKGIIFNAGQTKNPPERAGFCFYLSFKSWRSFLRPAISAIDWSVCCWLKRKFGDFFSTLRTLPVSLDCFPRSKISPWAVIEFSEGHIRLFCFK